MEANPSRCRGSYCWAFCVSQLIPGCSRPLALDAALARIDAWLALDNIHIAREKGDHWDVLRALLASSGMVGNLTLMLISPHLRFVMTRRW